MTKIEERAKKYCIDNYDLPPSKTTHAAMGYIQGATEQRQIDIDKACEWLMSVSKYEYVNCNEELRKEALVRDFRKAMEE